jgi:hypothetical protein
VPTQIRQRGVTVTRNQARTDELHHSGVLCFRIWIRILMTLFGGPRPVEFAAGDIVKV